MLMPGRTYGAMGRHGFNGKEQDKEIKGEGNSYDFGARIYDPRIVRWSSVDPLTRKYADVSPYVAFANNPIIIIDPDGEDIVYFNSLGVEYKRIVSKTQFETYVDVKKQVRVIHFIPEFDAQGKIKPFVETRTVTSPVKVPMPDIITEKLETRKGKDGQWIVEKGLDDKKYQQYDYQIAASTFLFNQSKNDGTQQFVTDGGVKIPTSITSKVSDVSPTDVKELMMQETHCGTYLPNNGTIDIMQVNNGLNNFQDYKPYKANYGLSSGVVPGPLLSLTAGLKDLMTKGFRGGVTYDKKTGQQTFTFQGWLQAGKNYNGDGVPNYKESLQRMEATKRTPTANDY